MGRHSMAKPRRRRRWSVAVAAVVVPVAAFLSSGTASGPSTAGATAALQASGAELVAAPVPVRAMRNAAFVFNPDAGESVVLSASAASRSHRRVLPQGVAPETGLQVKTILAARSISAVFPEVTAIGGLRQDYLKWHPNGLAIDVMIPGWDTDAGKALGNEVVAYVLANKERFGLDHVIWRQIIWSKSRAAPHVMTHAGSADADHFTHVHIATEGGGYPTGLETYFG